MRLKQHLSWLSIVIVLLWMGCSNGQEQHAESSVFGISSPAFTDFSRIPRKYTCEGENISPPLTWQGIPPGTESLALIVEDPDAPDPVAPRMIWTHWILFNIPPTLKGLPEAAEHLPSSVKSGRNSWNTLNYGGPCPPIGCHRYFFRLYALDSIISKPEGITKEELIKAMEGHIIATATLVGTYQKSR